MFILKNVVYKDIINIKYLHIPKNTVSFISGDSGSGKTTLFKLLNHTLMPDSGEIVCTNSETFSRNNVLLVSQKVFLYKGSILENFEKFYNMRCVNLPNIEFLTSILDIFNICLDINQDVNTMSGGERLRIYTAIFLSFMPNIILLDEPTASLDEGNSIIVMQNIITFCKSNNIGLVIISHNTNIINKFSENTIYIKGIQ